MTLHVPHIYQKYVGSAEVNNEVKQPRNIQDVFLTYQVAQRKIGYQHQEDLEESHCQKS